ncbi:MerR family transcriptional regulator [Lawsonibacter celer]|uniref:MerR family transcriptional regulator n=1 Tax=Lawsonibacter celer TaxID=2986526 RepID=UPI001644F054|nr:MerR family transcriptional regulator [Lawsonibacter celer]
MTIGELERELGMTRANIRFYEQEGLLSPHRGENGYRDYAPEDVETLRKIKLLRQLRLPVEEIRRIQRGERALADAAAEQGERLREEESGLALVGELCRELRAEGVSYADLDAGRYLARLERPPARPSYFSLQQDRLRTVAHPWRRYFARNLDLALYGLLWGAVRLLLLRWDPFPGFWTTLLENYITCGLMLLLEPTLLSTWGYTPGKWLFGLTVRYPGGHKLSWGDAFARTWGVFGRGFGWGIPIYNLVRQVKCCVACGRGEAMEWEQDADNVYTIRDTRALRCVGYAAASAVAVGLGMLVSLQARMPIHRGNLTPAQYAQNVNDAIAFRNLSQDFRMEADGSWTEDRSPVTAVVSAARDSATPPDHALTVDGEGHVTGVRLEVTRTITGFTRFPVVQEQLAALAFVAARPEYTCLTWASSDVLERIERQSEENYTFQAGGVTIAQCIEYRGYTNGSGFLFAEDSEPVFYHLIFTLEITE